MTRARATSTAKKPADDVRGRVLAAAVKLIEKDGLAALSMREVARAAGVSHQAPYHYFADRESILAAIAEEGFTILGRRLENAVDPDEPPAERLATLGRVYVEFACDHPALFRVMFRPDFVHIERFPETRACGERAFALVPAAVQAAIVDGLPPEPSVEALVVVSWSVAHGLACLLLDGPLQMKLPDAVKHRDVLIRDVMATMRAMFEARAAEGRRKTGSRRPATKRAR